MPDSWCPSSSKGYPSDCELTEALRQRARKRSAPVPRSRQWRDALVHGRSVELLLLDVDGVLTDGTLYYDQDGGEIKGFNTKDGFGLHLLRQAGLEVGIITARTSAALARRARDLGITRLHQGRRDKQTVFADILQETGLRPVQTAYMGDDWLDLPILQQVGLSAAPADGVAEVRQRVHYVTSRAGGRGAVRELCDLILEARGKLDPLLKKYL